MIGAGGGLPSGLIQAMYFRSHEELSLLAVRDCWIIMVGKEFEPHFFDRYLMKFMPHLSLNFDDFEGYLNVKV
ncbi:hypothetical protein DSUL_20054 [Desulfovibrionales bacterium]